MAAGTVTVVGLWAHLAYADAPGHPTIRRQAEEFGRAVDHAEGAGIRPEVRHLANSAATLTAPEQHFDLVRPGLAVYGLSPVPDLGYRSVKGMSSRSTRRPGHRSGRSTSRGRSGSTRIATPGLMSG